jgi:hypothetical protein
LNGVANTIENDAEDVGGEVVDTATGAADKVGGFFDSIF